MESMNDYSELAQPFRSNPDPTFAGCLNTQKEEPGVVFPGVTPLEAAYCFIGETSLIEGLASLYNITPNKLRSFLKGSDTTKSDVAALKAEVKDLKKQVASYDAFKDAAEEAGLFVTKIK